MTRRGIRSYLSALLVCHIFLVATIGLNYAVLWRAGELKPVDAIISQQENHGAIYGGLMRSFADYKYAAYQRRSPEIVALGTSRAMQIRQRFFLKRFYNLGGLVQGPGQANAIADRLLLRGSSPKIVIYSLDYWTFCASSGEVKSKSKQEGEETTHDGMVEPRRSFLIYRLWSGGYFSISDYFHIIFDRRTADNDDRVGVSVRRGKSGFAIDGSVYSAPPKGRALAERWADEFDHIEKGIGQMVKDCVVSETAIESLRRFTDKMKAHNIKIILIMAPLPGAVVDHMHSTDRYGYVADLARRLSILYPDKFFDFFDMRRLAPDSEFADGLHGGEVAYMRILQQIAMKPGSALSDVIDLPALEREITSSTGYVVSPSNLTYKRFYPRETPIHR